MNSLWQNLFATAVCSNNKYNIVLKLVNLTDGSQNVKILIIKNCISEGTLIKQVNVKKRKQKNIIALLRPVFKMDSYKINLIEKI